MIYRSILVSLFVIGAGYVLLTAQILLDPWSEMDAINSRTLPYLYGIGLMLCALALVSVSYTHLTLPTNREV